MNIKVLLVDDHKIIRDGLSAILRIEDDICVIAEAATGQEAREQIKLNVPDVVVMDLALPDMGGMQITRGILSDHPEVKVLILTMFLDENCVLESLEAGARGFLVKDCAAEELVAAIRSIHQGKPYFCAGCQEIMMRRCVSGPVATSSSSDLTKRETEVLILTAQGLCTKEIAFDLGVSIKMVEAHRMNVRRKLGVHSIAQLTTYALKNGLITA